MKSEGLIKQGDNGLLFYDKEKKAWYDISEADMGHKTDAVKYWNKVGRKFGPKSKEVRQWMLNSDNYELQHYSSNRSNGAKLTDRYKKPIKKKNSRGSTYSKKNN